MNLVTLPITARSISQPRIARCPSVSGAGDHGARGFTLLEVMIALALFFMVTFAILTMVSQGLAAARNLQRNPPTVGLLASDLLTTNRLEEGTSEGDFGELYPDYAWTREIIEEQTNGLFRVTFTIVGFGPGRPYESVTELYLWRPDSQPFLPSTRRR